MSATLGGAVWSCGPNSRTLRPVLAAIADNADDFGFACPSIATIAAKVCCDSRTAMRMVQELERQQWMRVCRKVLGGKGSVYFINLEKLGVTENPRMRRSQLHVEVAKRLADKESAKPQKSGGKLSPEGSHSPLESGDNPQGVQVTKSPESGDKTLFPILKNRKEPSIEPIPPVAPLSGGACELQWRLILRELEKQVNPHSFATWFKPTRFLRAEGKNLVVGVPSEEFGHLGYKYSDVIRKVIARLRIEVGAVLFEAPTAAAKVQEPTIDADFAACDSAEAVVKLLMHRLGICAERMVAVLNSAIVNEAERSNLSLAEVGYLAWRNYTAYAEQSGSLRYSWGPRKFFSEGHWLKPGSWPRNSGPMRL